MALGGPFAIRLRDGDVGLSADPSEENGDGDRVLSWALETDAMKTSPDPTAALLRQIRDGADRGLE
jgi:hypothetical protein